MTPDAYPRGYRMPPEWGPHEATWLAWPHDPRTWVRGLEPVRESYVAMIEALAPSERVELLVPDQETATMVERRLRGEGLDVVPWAKTDDKVGSSGIVRLHTLDYADAWLRDTGPTVVKNADRHRVALDWRFDAWGGKYESLKRDDRLAGLLADRAGLERVRVETVLEGGAIDVNGQGLALTTEQCLLNPNRGSDRTRQRMESLLERFLGVEKVHWLGDGITGDDTDGHVDDIARFAGPGHVLACRQPDADDPDHAPLEANLERLAGMTRLDGSPLEVTTLPMPDPVTYEGQRLPASYANFYVGNETILLPIFGCKQDHEAERLLAEAFPQRRIVPIDAGPLVVGFGACHCLTQQLPA